MSNNLRKKHTGEPGNPGQFGTTTRNEPTEHSLGGYSTIDQDIARRAVDGLYNDSTDRPTLINVHEVLTDEIESYRGDGPWVTDLVDARHRVESRLKELGSADA